MQISKVHAELKGSLAGQGPKVDKVTGQRRRQNRGVVRAYRERLRAEAEARNKLTPPDRRRSARR